MWLVIVDKSGMSGKFKAWIHQHSLLATYLSTRSQWRLLRVMKERSIIFSTNSWAGHEAWPASLCILKNIPHHLTWEISLFLMMSFLLCKRGAVTQILLWKLKPCLPSRVLPQLAPRWLVLGDLQLSIPKSGWNSCPHGEPGLLCVNTSKLESGARRQRWVADIRLDIQHV